MAWLKIRCPDCKELRMFKGFQFPGTVEPKDDPYPREWFITAICLDCIRGRQEQESRFTNGQNR